MRLIDADVAINAIEKTYGMISYHEDGFTRSDAIDIIKALPSVQEERKTGKWIRHNHKRQCNNCRAIMLDSGFENFCPNCGSYNGG